jgi:hypothetical protein
MNMGDREENSIIEALNFRYSHDMGDAQMPLGLTFHPTDEELITHYLIEPMNHIIKFEIDSLSLLTKPIP